MNSEMISTNHENSRSFCVLEISIDAVVASPNSQYYLHTTKIRYWMCVFVFACVFVCFYTHMLVVGVCLCISLYKWLIFKEQTDVWFFFSHSLNHLNQPQRKWQSLSRGKKSAAFSSSSSLSSRDLKLHTNIF